MEKGWGIGKMTDNKGDGGGGGGGRGGDDNMMAGEGQVGAVEHHDDGYGADNNRCCCGQDEKMPMSGRTRISEMFKINIIITSAYASDISSAPS